MKSTEKVKGKSFCQKRRREKSEGGKREEGKEMTIILRKGKYFLGTESGEVR